MRLAVAIDRDQAPVLPEVVVSDREDRHRLAAVAVKGRALPKANLWPFTNMPVPPPPSFDASVFQAPAASFALTSQSAAVAAERGFVVVQLAAASDRSSRADRPSTSASRSAASGNCRLFFTPEVRSKITRDSSAVVRAASCARSCQRARRRAASRRASTRYAGRLGTVETPITSIVAPFSNVAR